MTERLRINKFKIAFVSILLGNILIWSFYFSLPDGKLHIKVYDVGQGDSILIKTASGKTVLVDGGPDNSVLGYLGGDIPFYSKNIDLVVLTHPDADHLTGLIEVVKQYKVRKIWVNGVNKDTRVCQDWEKALSELNLKVEIVKAGSKLKLKDSLILSVIWPPKDFISSKTNLAGIVIKLSYGEFDALLTADADKNAQPYTSSLGQIEVLKVPHHGASESVSEAFLNLTSPEVSIISVGEKNPYNHPRQEALDLLKKSGSKIYRTDKDGSIEIVSNGESWYTKTSQK